MNKSLLLQHHEDIGNIFQDQENMAAILVRKHEDSGDLMMVSFNIFFSSCKIKFK